MEIFAISFVLLFNCSCAVLIVRSRRPRLEPSKTMEQLMSMADRTEQFMDPAE